MSNLTHQVVRVATCSPDERGCLVFADDELVAVVVKLSGDIHQDLGGLWFIEAGFGPCAAIEAQVFGSVDEVDRSIRKRLKNGN